MHLTKIFILRYLFFPIIFFLSFNIYAAPTTYCEKFVEEIRKNQTSKRLDWGPRPISLLEAGFYLKEKYIPGQSEFTERWAEGKDEDGNVIVFEDSEDEGVFKFIRNENNNVEVLIPVRYNENYEVNDAYKKLQPNDEIISLNGKNVSKMSDEEIYNILYPEEEKYDYYENNDLIIEYKRLNNKIASTNISYEYTSFINYTLDFIINSIFNLNSKDTTFDLNYYLYMTWDYNELVPIAKELNKKIQPPTDEFNLDYLAYCGLDEDEFDNLEMYAPSFDIKNILYISDDTFKTDYILDYWEYDDEDKTGGASLSSTDIGIATLQSDFDFSAFPFDSQVLKIELYKDIWDEYFVNLRSFFRSFQKIDIKEIDRITDWDITHKSLTAEYYFDKYQSDYMPKFSINLRIERNYLYYLYKIFIPIFIILLVAWSALWIRPSQIEARLTVTIVCLLSLIAYNYIYEGDLPKLDYITLMDYIILLAYAFAAIPTVVSVISYERYKNNMQNENNIDSVTKIVGPVAFLLISTFIAFMMIYGNENISMTLRSLQGMKN